jgi:hypothetical protein
MPTTLPVSAAHTTALATALRARPELRGRSAAALGWRQLMPRRDARRSGKGVAAAATRSVRGAGAGAAGAREVVGSSVAMTTVVAAW